MTKEKAPKMPKFKTEIDKLKERVEGHTQGPLSVCKGDEADAVVLPNGLPITWDDHSGEVFTPADAQLIAAAPKMLAALEAIGALAEIWRSTPTNPSPFDAALHHAAMNIESAIQTAFLQS